MICVEASKIKKDPIFVAPAWNETFFGYTRMTSGDYAIQGYEIKHPTEPPARFISKEEEDEWIEKLCKKTGGTLHYVRQYQDIRF